ncbi:ubiquitin carboxyl-terminal hydrolase 24 [Lates japonicus]|uniref:Ubiquitin carboxyl-terminal hydrolase 24 n=1 Tax=Lates japonicus TaxID=270547 RepID=A0AAD3N5C4_LATJO|nr:ubiquitin carboxyl-terminal hydrolase 24 [Lates japonicus]
MGPYVSGMARQDCSGRRRARARTSGGSPRKKVTISENYELVGVVVHSGQAHAGHYYSFIKDRRPLRPAYPSRPSAIPETQMTEHYWTPQSNVSNETSTNKTFQRTISAQDTLAYATALLNEKEQSGSSNGSDGSPANEDVDRSLRQGSESPMMLGDSKSDLEDVDP